MREDCLIDALDLSVRAYNVLKRAGINTVEELAYTDISEIRRRTGTCLNRKVFDEILSKLEEFGIQSQRKEIDDMSSSENRGDVKAMNVDELAKKLAKELLKDQGLKMKTLVFFDEKKEMLDELYDEVSLLRDAWCEKFDKLSERMQESSRGEKIEEIYELLDSITTSLEDADSFIEELKEKLEDNE